MKRGWLILLVAHMVWGERIKLAEWEKAKHQLITYQETAVQFKLFSHPEVKRIEIAHLYDDLRNFLYGWKMELEESVNDWGITPKSQPLPDHRLLEIWILSFAYLRQLVKDTSYHYPSIIKACPLMKMRDALESHLQKLGTTHWSDVLRALLKTVHSIRENLGGEDFTFELQIMEAYSVDMLEERLRILASIKGKS